MVAYRPLIPGTPEASAYAMPTGTSMVVMTRPATRSYRSQDDSYRRRVFNPGSQCIQPVRFACIAWRAMRPGSVVWEECDSVMAATSRERRQGDILARLTRSNPGPLASMEIFRHVLCAITKYGDRSFSKRCRRRKPPEYVQNTTLMTRMMSSSG